METLSQNQTVLNISLTTTPKEIKLPPGISAEACMIVCTFLDTAVAWRKQNSENDTESILYPASQTFRNFRVNEGAVMFWAKTVTGTGVLEIDVLS